MGIESYLQEVTELCLALMLWAYGLHWWWEGEAEPPGYSPRDRLKEVRILIL